MRVNPPTAQSDDQNRNCTIILFTPEYESKGPFDLLNRGNLLRLLSTIPSLNGLCSADLLSVEFIKTDRTQDKEATKATWTSSKIVNKILDEQNIFKTWRIKSVLHHNIGYPLPLLERPQYGPSTKNSKTTSVLRCALGRSPTKTQGTFTQKSSMVFNSDNLDDLRLFRIRNTLSHPQ